jgi:hypothetical protein
MPTINGKGRITPAFSFKLMGPGSVCTLYEVAEFPTVALQ